MNIFDVVGLASKVPYDLIQKLQTDMPKLQQLMALEKEAEPHINALMPIAKEAEAVWGSISPDVMKLIGVLK